MEILLLFFNILALYVSTKAIPYTVIYLLFLNNRIWLGMLVWETLCSLTASLRIYREYQKSPYIGQMNTFEQKIFQYSASTTLQRSATTVKFCSCLQITVHYVPPQFNKLPKSSRLKDRHIFHQTVSPTLLLVRNGILVWEEAFNAVYIRSHGQMGLLSSKGFLLHHPSF